MSNLFLSFLCCPLQSWTFQGTCAEREEREREKYPPPKLFIYNDFLMIYPFNSWIVFVLDSLGSLLTIRDNHNVNHILILSMEWMNDTSQGYPFPFFLISSPSSQPEFRSSLPSSSLSIPSDLRSWSPFQKYSPSFMFLSLSVHLTSLTISLQLVTMKCGMKKRNWKVIKVKEMIEKEWV